jgi:teichoic acid transport system permease protein
MHKTAKLLIKELLRYFKVAVLAGFYKFKDSGDGRVLGLFWEFGKPIVFALAMGVAISVGMKGKKAGDDIFPYLIWLISGYFAWNFMSGTYNSGPGLFRKERKLVWRRVVPLTLLPIVTMTQRSIIFLGILSGTLILGIFAGVGPHLAWIQIPVIFVIMIVYWYFFTLVTASIGTLSSDFAMFVRVLTQPLFWTSGVIFDVSHIKNSVFQAYLDINPFAFFISSYRRIAHDGAWILAEIDHWVPFFAVFTVTVLLACVVYHKTKLEVRNEIRNDDNES